MGLGSLFKKKKDDLDLGLDTGIDSSINNQMNAPAGDFHLNEPSNFDTGQSPAMNLSTMNMQGFHQESGGDIQKDLQILSLKLDSIKSELDSINQRLKNLESIAEKEQQQQQSKKWY